MRFLTTLASALLITLPMSVAMVADLRPAGEPRQLGERFEEHFEVRGISLFDFNLDLPDINLIKLHLSDINWPGWPDMCAKFKVKGRITCPLPLPLFPPPPPPFWPTICAEWEGEFEINCKTYLMLMANKQNYNDTVKDNHNPKRNLKQNLKHNLNYHPATRSLVEDYLLAPSTWSPVGSG
ncbi:hypothetical protein FDECE_3942 [Fusarium decemcellulare]|nr:hypothetical protein FDECE_3942 [Fusarium decemcellulare]